MKNKKIIIIFGVILFMVVLGVSYAWLSTTIFGKKEYVLKAGDLDLVLDETSNGLMIEDDLPVEDSIGIQGEGATFSVRNNGSSDICYQIYLDDGDLLDQEVRVEDKFVKYSVEKDGVVGEANVLSSGRLIDNMEIRAGKSVNYKLRLWFNIEEDGQIAGQVFKGKLRIEAVQCKMRAYTSGSTEDYHTEQYRSKVTSITTKDNSLIPDNVIKSWDVSQKADQSVIAYAQDDGAGGYSITIGGDGGILANPDSSFLFSKFSAMTDINTSFLNTQEVTNMTGMFDGCKSLINLDITNFDTSKVESMFFMFRNCNQLTNLDVSNFNTSKVTNMQYMFQFCHSLITLDLISFDTSNVTNMAAMFWECFKLRNIKFSKDFNTSKVTKMNNMFGGTNVLILDLTMFDTAQVDDMRQMFANCSALEQILVSNKWVIANADITNMFVSCKINQVTVI